MKSKKLKIATKAFVKGCEPRTILFKSGQKFKTSGLKKKDWDQIKKDQKEALKSFSRKDKENFKAILSI